MSIQSGVNQVLGIGALASYGLEKEALEKEKYGEELFNIEKEGAESAKKQLNKVAKQAEKAGVDEELEPIDTMPVTKGEILGAKREYSNKGIIGHNKMYNKYIGYAQREAKDALQYSTRTGQLMELRDQANERAEMLKEFKKNQIENFESFSKDAQKEIIRQMESKK